MSNVRKKQEQAKEQLEQLNQQIQTALKLLTSEEADAIIGEQPEEHKMLLDAIQASSALLFSFAQSNGLRKSPKTLKFWSQNQVILLTLIHYAYALGMKRGKDAQS